MFEGRHQLAKAIMEGTRHLHDEFKEVLESAAARAKFGHSQ